MSGWRDSIIATVPKPKSDDWRSSIIADQIPASPPEPKTSTAEALLQGEGQGGTLNYLPAIQAATEKAGQVILPQSLGGTPLGQSEDFDKIKKYYEAQNQTMKEEHPVATAIGNVAGAVGTYPLAEAGLAKAGLGPATAGASNLVKYAKAMGQGAAYGAAQNTEGEGFDPYERLKNAGIGLGSGVAGEALSQGVGALEGTGKFLTDRTTVKQIGANAGQIKKLLQKDEIPMIGEFMNNEGLMAPGKTVDDVASHTAQILKEDGPKIGQLYKDAQAAAATTSIGEANRISGPDLADEIVKKVMAQAKNHPDRDLVKKTIDESMGPLRDMGDNAGLSDLHQYRKGLDENINWGAGKGMQKDAVQNAYLTARNTVNDAVKNQISALDQALGGNKLDELKALNDRFSTASTINTMAEQGQGRNMAKALLGAGAIGAGTGGLAAAETYRETHDPIKAAAMGLAAGVGGAAARRYSPAIGYSLGRGLQSAAPAISNAIEPAVTAAGTNLGTQTISPWLQVKKKQPKQE